MVRAGLTMTLATKASQGRRGPLNVHETGPTQHQRPVILREPFGQPQLTGHVDALEVEGLERSRAYAFDVPAVKELMRHGIEKPDAIVPQRAGRGHHRAVAMLHRIVGGVGQILREKGVIARLVRRILAVDLAFLANNLLDVPDEPVELGVGTGVVQRQPERPVAGREPAARDRTKLCGAVHQVLKVRRGEFEGGRASLKLRGDLPGPVYGRVEGHGDGAVVEAARPHDDRRHVDVRVGRIDREIRAVDVIAEDLVFDGDDAAVVGNGPAVGIRPGRRNLAALATEGVDVVDVLREIMQRVPPRRRAAHSQLERRAAQLVERGLDLHPAVLRLGKGEAVPNRTLPRQMTPLHRRRQGQA